MSKKIAIVEDDLDQRENYSDALRSEGYEVTAYADKD
ncbi:MAG: DNA-binding response regulator, partial [Thiotrichales bacterium]|nr:DNA-binding response regulator [Thiotrichales bacterium]